MELTQHSAGFFYDLYGRIIGNKMLPFPTFLMDTASL